MADTILFDFDGTLSESGPGTIYGICHTLAQFGFTIDDPSSLSAYIGPTIRETFSSVFHLEGETLDHAVQIYRAAFREEGIYRVELYPGIPEMLHQLKEAGKTLAIATSKPTPQAVEISKRFGILDYFSCVSGGSMDGKRCDKTLVIQTALDELGINDHDYRKCLMVGDRKYDVLGAKPLGISCVGVCYGYGSRAELTDAGAIHTVDSVSELTEFLRMH